MLVRSSFLPAVLLLPITDVYGWGKEGHEMVANIAYRLLSDDTQNIIIDILDNNKHHNCIHENSDCDNIRNNNDYDTPLGLIASWADDIKHRKEFQWTSPLHYLDIRDDLVDGGCHFNSSTEEGSPCSLMYERDCPGDFCVIGAIVNNTAQLLAPITTTTTTTTMQARKLMLRSPTANQQQQQQQQEKLQLSQFPRNESLMFLTHFVGDIHQPLHSSRASDRGGNEIHVKFDEKTLGITHHKHHHDDEWNLHAIWDTGIIEKTIREDYNNSQEALENNITKEYVIHRLLDDNNSQTILDYYKECFKNNSKSNNNNDLRSCIIEWAKESWELALDYAYTATSPGGDQEDIVNGYHLDDEYYETRLQIIKKQIAYGGIRLAAILEYIFQPMQEKQQKSDGVSHQKEDNNNANGEKRNIPVYAASNFFMMF